jgi:membrane fusion protein, macrolide-specific efflux system
MNKYNIHTWALVLTAGMLLGAGCGNKPDAPTQSIKPFRGQIKVAITSTGTVQPQNRLEIKPPISGRIDKILVEEGQKVKAGTVLALMSSTDRAALLDAAQLEGPEALKKWQEVYKATPLLAPIDGDVIVKKVYPGQTVTQADAVIVLSDRLIVQADVDETDIGKIKIGQEAVITLDAYQGITVNAKVDHIYYESTTVSNVTIYKVDIVPETVPDVFRSGMSANIDIIELRKDNVLLIPLSAVRRSGEQRLVLLKQRDGRPVEREIITGITLDNNIEVVSGLKEEDEILTIGKVYALPSQKAASNSPLAPSFPKRRGH